MLLMGFLADILGSFGSSVFGSPSKVLWIFLMMIFAGILGSFYGILMYKSAALGFAVYIITIILIIIGVAVYVGFSTIPSLGGETAIQFAAIMDSFIANPAFIVVFIAGGVILSAVNWLLVKKLEVKT
jgi:hypothetical protein